MAYKTSAIVTFALAIIIKFAAVYGHSQCMERNHQDARCRNIANQLAGAQIPIENLTKCLKAECLKTPGTAVKECEDPPRKIIPGFNALSINNTLTIEDFLKDISKRTVIHIIHNNEIRKYLKTTCGQKKRNDVKVQMNVIRNWIKETQQNLGFSSVVEGSMPPKLTSTGAKTAKNWYDVQIQMLRNLSKDFADMRRYFESNKTCIIPAC